LLTAGPHIQRALRARGGQRRPSTTCANGVLDRTESDLDCGGCGWPTASAVCADPRPLRSVHPCVCSCHGSVANGVGVMVRPRARMADRVGICADPLPTLLCAPTRMQPPMGAWLTRWAGWGRV
jgi:hypothetical protein